MFAPTSRRTSEPLPAIHGEEPFFTVSRPIIPVSRPVNSVSATENPISRPADSDTASQNRSAPCDPSIVIEDKIWHGINSTILPGVRIDYDAIVGANSVVTHDVPPMTVVGGNPARFIKKIETKKAE